MPKKKDIDKSEYREEKLDEIVSEVVRKEKERKAKQLTEQEELEKELEVIKKTKVKKEKTEEEKKELEAVKNILEEKKQLPREENLMLNENIFFNLFTAILAIAYFIFLTQLYKELDAATLLLELRVLSLGFLGVTIILFEAAYKKDSGTLAVTSIEFLAFSVINMLLIYVYMMLNERFPQVLPIIAIAFGIYYTIKCIVIYFKTRKTYFMKKMKKEIKKD